MHKILLVAQRELIENVRTKGFWIGILVFPLIFVIAAIVPTLLDKAKSARQYAVIDKSGWLLDEVDREIMTRDLSIILNKAADPAAAPDSTLPQGLQSIVQSARAFNPQQFGIAAALLAGDTARGTDSLPASVRALIQRHRAEILAWWNNLDPKEARHLSKRVSKRKYVRINVQVPEQEAVDSLNRLVGKDELFAYFVIPADPVAGTEPARYVSRNLTDEDLRQWFGRIASAHVQARRLAQERIAPETAQWIQRPIRFDTRQVSGSGEEKEVNPLDLVRQWAPVAFVYVLWISIFMITQMLLTNTIEEKSNRIIEVLLSSVSPVQLMMGKIVGIAATGLTIVLSWAAAFVAGTKLLPRFVELPAGFDLSLVATDPRYMVSFLVYFVLGYLFFASILVGIGSVSNTLKEAQNLMMPVTLLLMAPLFSMLPIARDPNGLLARVLSYIPPFTPFVMMNRAAGPPTTFEYITTTALLIVAVFVGIWGAAKVFRIGILMTGKPPKIREILGWLKAPVGAVPNRKE